ncbi:MAG: hypothetical protein JWQ10_383 [Herbaspirillum sp.]|jgi:hypothetical protein|nr:hypothetical protein [Herbaspirillum sp.]
MKFAEQMSLTSAAVTLISAAFCDQGGVENVMADNSVITVEFMAVRKTSRRRAA